MPIFGSFSGNLSRKTIEAVQKAVEGPKLETVGAPKSGAKPSSYLAAVQGQTEDLEAQMKQMTLATKDTMNVNMVEISESKASEEAIRQEQANRTAFPRENENLAEFLQRCQKKKIRSNVVSSMQLYF